MQNAYEEPDANVLVQKVCAMGLWQEEVRREVNHFLALAYPRSLGDLYDVLGSRHTLYDATRRPQCTLQYEDGTTECSQWIPRVYCQCEYLGTPGQSAACCDFAFDQARNDGILH